MTEPFSIEGGISSIEPLEPQESRVENLEPFQDVAVVETESVEQPIKFMVWPDVPTVHPEIAIRERASEFFKGSEVPPELKALGFLTNEKLVTACKELERVHFQTALWQGTPYKGEPTIYGMKLFTDRLELALSSVRDYGADSGQVTSIPIKHLDSITGGVALEIAQDLPDLVETLLSTKEDGISNEARCQAKLDLMRYLVKAHPEYIKGRGEAGGLIPNVGLSFTIDSQTSILLLNANEIPSSDPILGDMADLYTKINTFRQAVSHIDKANYNEMTTKKIETFLLSLPDWMQKILMGRDAGSSSAAGCKSWRILQFLEKFGFKGNEQQQRVMKSMNINFALINLDAEMREKMLRTIVNGSSLEAESLTRSELDKIFKNLYEKRNRQVLPDSFSITRIVEDDISLDEIQL